MIRRTGYLSIAVLALCCSAFGQAVALNCGTPVNGDFTVGPSNFYSFTADPGDSILVRLVSTDKSPIPKVQVTDPVGRQLPILVSLIADATNFAADYELGGGGPYQLRVNAPSPAAQGTYRLSYTFVNKPCGAPTVLSCGAGLQDQLSAPQQIKTYQFDTQAGDVVSLRYVRAGASPGAAVLVYASGRLIQVNNQAVRVLFPRTGGRLDFLVSSSATLTFVLFDPANNTGSFGLVATRLNRPCGSGKIDCGAVTQSAIAGAFNVDSYSLAVSPGDIFSLQTTALTGSLVPVLEAYDAKGQSVPLTAGSIGAGRTVLTFSAIATAAGPYTILARDGSSTAANTGSYGVGLVRFNRPCTSQALSCSSLVDGSVSGLLGASQYTLPAGAGDAFLLRLLHSDQGALFRPRLDVFDQKGSPVYSVPAGDAGKGVFVAPSDGTYLLVVSDGFDSSQSGSYSLSTTRLNRPCAATALSCGGVKAGTLSRSLAAGVYTFQADPGDAFTVRMIDPAGTLQPSLEIYNAQGEPAGQPLGGNYTGVDVSSPAGGVYTIVASDAARRSTGGAFSVSLLRTRNSCGAAPAPGDTVNGVVSGAAPFAAYRISAAAGDSLVVRSASLTPGFSAQMELYDPNGSRVDSQTFSISRKAAAAGNYTVVVGASAPRTAGGYQLSWQLLNSPAGALPLQCGGTTGASLSAARQFRYYSAAVNAGDLIRLLFTKTSDNFSPQIELFDPAGARLSANADTAVKAAVDGNYLVVVSPSSSNSELGSYSLAFQRPNNPCGAAQLTCGQSTLRQVNLPGQLDTLTFTGTGGDQADIRTATRSGSYSPFLELYDSSGNRIATSSSGALQPALPASGPYTLLVRDRGAVNLGSYRVSLQDTTHACPVNDTEPPSITLVQPTGGDVIAGGTPFRILWQSDDNVGLSTHDIALSADGGKTFSTSVAGALSGNAQAYTWSVPPDIAPSRIAMIRITATDGAGNMQSAVSGPLTVIGAGFTPNNSVTYTYDSLNRLTSALLSDGRTVRYAWDSAGNLIAVTVTGP